MKKLVVLFLSIGISFSNVVAQKVVKGRVVDAVTSKGLYGVSLFMPDSKLGTTTDQQGNFEISGMKNGDLIRFSFVGYGTQEIEFAGQESLLIKMSYAQDLEEIIIRSIRAGEYAPISQATVGRKEIDRIHVGQDALFMLESTTPSMISYSESGTSFSNYGQFRLRGIDQSRVNITLNGAPLNDMIDQGVFFSNFTDFSNSIQSVQVQRGVGTSTNGTASFAGSINFESVNLSDAESSAEIELVGGSFNTYRGSAAAKTGLMDSKTAFYTRFSSFTSDGYRYNSGTDSYSFYGSGGYFGKKDLVKFTTFVGRTENGLAYSPVAISAIKNDPRTNYLNENDIDNFGQWFFQLQHTHLFSGNTSLVSSAYYGGSGGDFPFGFFDENGTLVQINYPLTNDHVGIMSTINSESHDAGFNVSAGIHAYAFIRTNLESIIPDDKNPYYKEHSRKDEISLFGKADYLVGKARIFVDLQIRALKLDIDPDKTLLPNEGVITKNWTFVNPRVGINYELSKTKQLYVSFGHTGREPTKVDIFGGFNLNPSNLESVKSDDVKPEHVNDFELGVNFKYPSFYGQLNLFYMMFKDEIAPIGTYVPEGFLQLRKNMTSSFRRGLELDFTWELLSKLNFSGNFTYMNSEIEEYNPEDDPNVYNNVTPALSPEFITKGTLAYQTLSWLNFSVSGRYVSDSYQEPTNNELFKMPSFFVADLRAGIVFGNGHSFDLFFNNIFNKQYFTYGAPLDMDLNGSFDEPGYLVQPPRNFYCRLVFKF